MNSESKAASEPRKSDEPTRTRVNGSPRIKSLEFARRAKAMLSQLPSNLDAEMKRSPYATVGVAFVLGMGAGVVLGSRILRSVLASAASYAAVEIGRAYLRESLRESAGGARGVDH